MEPIIYWPSVFNKEDIKHAFILSSKRKPGHEQRLSLFPGFPGYSHDMFHTFLNTLVPRVFFSYTNFRHWNIGYQLRGGITHKHSDITRVVTAMDSWSHWHCLICYAMLIACFRFSDTEGWRVSVTSTQKCKRVIWKKGAPPVLFSCTFGLFPFADPTISKPGTGYADES